MTTKQPIPIPPPNPIKYIRLMPGHPYEGRIGVLGKPFKIDTGALFYNIEFDDDTCCYAADYEFEEIYPTSPPPPCKK